MSGRHLSVVWGTVVLLGSTTCKAVVIDADGQVLASRVEPADPRIEPQSRSMLESLSTELGVPKPLPLAATGYGRKRVSAAKVVTEITCHARGAFHLAATVESAGFGPYFISAADAAADQPTLQALRLAHAQRMEIRDPSQPGYAIRFTPRLTPRGWR